MTNDEMKKLELATKIGPVEAVKDADKGYNLLSKSGKFLGHAETKEFAFFIVAATNGPVSYLDLLLFMKEVREKRHTETNGLLS